MWTRYPTMHFTTSTGSRSNNYKCALFKCISRGRSAGAAASSWQHFACNKPLRTRMALFSLTAQAWFRSFAGRLACQHVCWPPRRGGRSGRPETRPPAELERVQERLEKEASKDNVGINKERNKEESSLLKLCDSLNVCVSVRTIKGRN